MADLKALLAPFLPCTEDWNTLRVMSDVCEENGELRMAKHLRWTANEWEWQRGLMRCECKPGREVWARFTTQGWSRAVIWKVTQAHVMVIFPHRDTTVNGAYQRGTRAWWDLEPRGECWLWEDRSRRKPVAKPAPRKGYGTGNNSKLAAFLTGRMSMKKLAVQADVEDTDFAQANFADLELFRAAMGSS